MTKPKLGMLQGLPWPHGLWGGCDMGCSVDWGGRPHTDAEGLEGSHSAGSTKVLPTLMCVWELLLCCRGRRVTLELGVGCSASHGDMAVPPTSPFPPLRGSAGGSPRARGGKRGPQGVRQLCCAWCGGRHNEGTRFETRSCHWRTFERCLSSFKPDMIP